MSTPGNRRRAPPSSPDAPCDRVGLDDYGACDLRHFRGRLLLPGHTAGALTRPRAERSPPFWLFPFLGFLPVGLLLALQPAASTPSAGSHSLRSCSWESGRSLASWDRSSSRDHIGARQLRGCSSPRCWNAPGGGAPEILLGVMLLTFPDGQPAIPSVAMAAVRVDRGRRSGIRPVRHQSGPGALGISFVAVPGVDPSAEPARDSRIRDAVLAVSTASNLVSYALDALVLISIFLRLRGADADRRHQIKWVAFGAVLTITTIIGLNSIPVGNTREHHRSGISSSQARC